MKRKVLILIISLVIIVGVTSISYAYLKVEKTSGSNTLTLSSLNVNLLTDITNLTLDNAYPVQDEQGLTNTPLTFQIKNDAVETARYMVSLVDPTNTVSTLLNKNIRYQLKKTSSANSVTETLDITNLSDAGLIDTGVIASGVTISYELVMWLDYNATISGSSTNFTFSKQILVEGMQVPNLDTSGANYPELLDNMIPVYYDETATTWKKADSKNLDANNKWYDYNNYQWANAVTVKATGTKTREEYLNSAVGTSIPMDDILAMWVWIPRYKYVVFNANNGETTNKPITVVFEHALETTGTITCTDTTSATSSQTCTDTTNSSIKNNKSTYTHPAFTFGTTQLTGFWAGKFEMSTDDANTSCTSTSVTNACNLNTLNILVKPDTISLRYQDVNNQFLNIRKMELAGNIHGFEQTGTTVSLTGDITNDSNNLDTHLIKNMEWGAIAYLANSQYGKTGNSLYTGDYKNIYNNNYYADNVYKTGYSSGTWNGATSTTTTYLYNNLTTTTNQGYIGAGASTTGTIYGIYDMSGGALEQVMANMTSSSNAFYPSGVTWAQSPQSKYYDKYSNSTVENLSRGRLADATREINPITNFKGNTLQMPYGTNSWLSRGGEASVTTSTIYTANNNNGTLASNKTTRPILTVQRELPWLD